jgi:hypothetical protein
MLSLQWLGGQLFKLLSAAARLSLEESSKIGTIAGAVHDEFRSKPCECMDRGVIQEASKPCDCMDRVVIHEIEHANAWTGE